MSFDVAIVGAGIVGTAIAREVARRGASVVVVDREEPCSQASWTAAGMLAPQGEAHGADEFLDLLIRARDGYPDLVASLEAETGRDLDYHRDGSLLVALDDADAAALDDRFEWQRSAGLPVERLSGDHARSREPSISDRVRSALYFPGDHRIDNRKLGRALVESALTAGATFDTSTVSAVELGTTPALRLESGRRLEASRIVVAAGAWSGGLAGLPTPLPVGPVHGQLVAFRPSPGVPSHILGSPRGYLVPRSDGRLIAGTTVEEVGFRGRTTEEGADAIREAAVAVIPGLAAEPIRDHWSGYRPAAPDRRPVLGPDPLDPRVIYATGHYRNGILLGPLTGTLIGRVATGAEPGFDLSPYRIDRFG